MLPLIALAACQFLFFGREAAIFLSVLFFFMCLTVSDFSSFLPVLFWLSGSKREREREREREKERELTTLFLLCAAAASFFVFVFVFLVVVVLCFL